MPRFGGDPRRQLRDARQRHAVFPDQPSERPAVAEPVERSGHDRAMDVHRRLVPRAEGPLGDVHLDALRRRSEPRVLPVVNGPRAVRRQVREPSLSHHPFEDPGRAVAEQVSAVDKHHRRTATSSVLNPLGAPADELRVPLADRSRLGRGIDQDLVRARQGLSSGQRIDSQATQIDWHDIHVTLRYLFSSGPVTQGLAATPRSTPSRGSSVPVRASYCLTARLTRMSGR